MHIIARSFTFQLITWAKYYGKQMSVFQFNFRKIQSQHLWKDSALVHRNFHTCKPKYIGLYSHHFTSDKPFSGAKKRKNHSRSTIIKVEAAYKLLTHLQEGILESDIIIELDPGHGVLTKLLLNSLNNKIILFQPSLSLQKELKSQFVNKHENIIFSPLSIHDAQKYFYKSQMTLNNPEYSNFLQTLQQHYSASSKLKLVGVISSSALLYIIMLNFAHQNMFYGSMNMSLMLFVSPDIYSSIMRLTKYKSKWRLGIFANICFDINCLCSAPENCFSTSKPKQPNPKKVDGCFHLIKLIPKESISSNDNIKIEADELASFYYFVNYFIRLRATTPFMAGLESFIPFIGKELIKNGFKVYDSPYYLTNDQWIKAFKIFSTHPNYHASPIMKMMTDEFTRLGYYDGDPDDDRSLEGNIS